MIYKGFGCCLVIFQLSPKCFPRVFISSLHDYQPLDCISRIVLTFLFISSPDTHRFFFLISLHNKIRSVVVIIFTGNFLNLSRFWVFLELKIYMVINFRFYIISQARIYILIKKKIQYPLHYRSASRKKRLANARNLIENVVRIADTMDRKHFPVTNSNSIRGLKILPSRHC
jgi:hypothetical protein